MSENINVLMGIGLETGRPFVATVWPSTGIGAMKRSNEKLQTTSLVKCARQCGDTVSGCEPKTQTQKTYSTVVWPESKVRFTWITSK